MTLFLKHVFLYMWSLAIKLEEIFLTTNLPCAFNFVLKCACQWANYQLGECLFSEAWI